MSVPPLEVLERPVRAAGRPATRATPATARHGSSRFATAVVLVVLTLGLLLVRVDAMPRTPTGSTPDAVASPVGLGPAAAAVTALVTAPAGQDPLAAVPADFPSLMGYTPVPMRMADGTRRLAKPTGACSVPGGGAPFGFDQACKVHDYGYDLLRYAHATGQHQTAEARRQLDAMFTRDLHARCQLIGRGLAGAGCHLVVELFTAGVSFNSWRQHHGNPAEERLPGWALGLVVPVLAAPFLSHLRGRRHTGGRGVRGGQRPDGPEGRRRRGRRTGRGCRGISVAARRPRRCRSCPAGSRPGRWSGRRRPERTESGWRTPRRSLGSSAG
jgi:Prokaryotic phospholipase A2